MSGGFKQSMVDRVGANRFIAEFDSDILAEAVIAVVQELSRAGRQSCRAACRLAAPEACCSTSSY